MLSTLSAELGKQGAALAKKEEQIVALTAAVGEIGKRLKTLSDTPKEPPVPVWCWATMDADTAAEAWAALWSWVGEVLQTRYPQSRAALMPCWYQHPDVVEELTALMAAWSRAFALPDSAPPAAIEWLDRWLPGVLRRVPEYLQRCRNRGAHEQQITDVVAVDLDAFDDWVQADLYEREHR